MTISRMYPQKPFSPETHLAAGIDAVATTIVLNDAAVLPDAPNLAIIEDGDNSEVVLYTTKDANSIGGCTRGFVVDGTRGIARVHTASTPVARYISSYDLNASRDNTSYLFSQQAIGVQWDRGGADTTALTLIDVDGNPIETLPFDSFDNHRTFREIRRCLLSTTGTPTYGENARGDGLTLDGSAGRVMVSIPKFWVKADNPSTGVYRWWISPIDLSGFEVHPAFHQRGGVDREYIYVSAYQANLLTRDFPAHASATLALHSRTGEQPATGAGTLKTIAFTSGGTTAPTIGETITGATSTNTAVLVDWYVTSGTWAGGDAAGTLIVKQASGAFGAENLNGSVAGANFATGATAANVELSISEARTFAENIGTGWGVLNIWTWGAVVLLNLIEAQSFNFQATLGRGVCDLAEGTGFAGRVNGYGSADATIGTNGTGMALGTNGTTPVVWRGIENLYGNVETWVDGIMAVRPGRYIHITPRSGTVPPSTPTAGAEIAVGVLSPSSAVTTDLVFEPLVRYLFLPKTAGGAGGTYLCDYTIPPANTPRSILSNGGPNGWYSGDGAGPFATNFFWLPEDTVKTIGARLEYIGPEGGSPATASITPGGGGEARTLPAPVVVTTPSVVPPAVSSTTPPPAATNPPSPNNDPPIYAVPEQTVQDGSLLGGFFGFGFNPSETFQIKFDAGALNMNATTCIMTGQSTHPTHAGITPTYSMGFMLYRTPTGLGAANYVSAGIPVGAKVKGFTVKRYGSYTGASPATGRDLKLFLRLTDPATPGGWIDSDDKAALTTDWGYNDGSTHEAFLATYGGPTDMWGFTSAEATPAILNSGGIQIVWQGESTANAGTAGDFRLYALQVEITYEV